MAQLEQIANYLNRGAQKELSHNIDRLQAEYKRYFDLVGQFMDSMHNQYRVLSQIQEYQARKQR